MANPETLTGSGPVARPGHNCWRRETASRLAWIIDSENYFDGLADALERAERTILIAGWDFDTRLRLRHDSDFPHLARLFSDAVAKNRQLRIYILVWDFPILFALDRELFPLLNFHPRTQGRIHFHFDSLHPVTASHHQKLVIIDDRVAFTGGIDLTGRRWDTSRHLPHDPRRVELANEPYRAYHDVQIAVEGDVAASMGALFRERWLRSAGTKVIPAAPEPTGDPWPPRLTPSLTDVPVAIARTDPMASPPVREIEELYLDLIASARHSIYFENQYLTSTRVGEAVAARLRERDGPEILVVSTERNPGWLEHRIMGVMRNELIRRLRASDRYGRLRIFYPYVGAIAGLPVFVHSKLAIFDDCCLRVGSANLSNRSMGIDTECDLVVEADGDARVNAAIADMRDRLLGEHLGVTPAEFRRSLDESGSLVAAVEKLRGQDHTLQPVEEEPEEWHNAVVYESLFLDPDEPVSMEVVVENLIPDEMKGKQRWRGIFSFVALSLLLVLGVAAWEHASLSDDFPPAGFYQLLDDLQSSDWAPAWALAFFVAGGLLLVPESALILVTALVFGAWPGAAYALAGTTANAAVMYGVGRLLGRQWVRQLARRRVNHISRQLARGGLGGILALRLYPVATFALTNLVAGGAGYRLRDFVLGTLAGMAPEVLAVTLFGTLLGMAAREPTPVRLALAWISAASILLLVSLLRGYPRSLRRRLAQRRRRRLARRVTKTA